MNNTSNNEQQKPKTKVTANKGYNYERTQLFWNRILCVLLKLFILFFA